MLIYLGWDIYRTFFGLLTCSKLHMHWLCVRRIFTNIPTVPASPSIMQRHSNEVLFPKDLQLLSVVTFDLWVGQSWSLVAIRLFIQRSAHDSAAVCIGISVGRDKTHTVDSLDYDWPQHQALPSNQSIWNKVCDWRTVSCVHHNPAISGLHQVRGCTEANRRSKCTTPLCCVAHYVSSFLILHKWDVRHRLPAQSISLPCNTHRHKMVLMPRLLFSPPGCDPQFQWPESHCRRWQQKKVSGNVYAKVLILSVLAASPCLNIWGWQSRTHTITPSLVSRVESRHSCWCICQFLDEGQRPTLSILHWFISYVNWEQRNTPPWRAIKATCHRSLPISSNQLPIDGAGDSLAIPNSAGKEVIVNISLLLLLFSAVFNKETSNNNYIPTRCVPSSC